MLQDVSLSRKPLSSSVEEDIEKQLINNITLLNKQGLCDIFERAKEIYVYGEACQDAPVPSAHLKLKGAVTFGFSYLSRYKKAQARLPYYNEITDANIKEILKKFFEGKGNSNIYSLKYQVARQVAGFYAKGKDAQALVKLVEKALSINADMSLAGEDNHPSVENFPHTGSESVRDPLVPPKSLAELTILKILFTLSQHDLERLPGGLKEKIHSNVRALEDFTSRFKAMHNGLETKSFNPADWMECHQFLCTLQTRPYVSLSPTAPKIIQQLLAHVIRKYPRDTDYKKLWEERKIPQADCLSLILLDRIPLDAVNNNQENTLHYVAKAGYTALVQWLCLKGANMEAPYISGNTALHFAARQSDPILLTYLLNKGAKMVSNSAGDTPLHVAAAANLPELISQLIAHKANIESKNNLGETPLHKAATNSNLAAMVQLLELEANIEAQDNERRTPLHKVVVSINRVGNEAAVQQLLKFKADINAQDKEGYTPLDLAVKESKKALYQQLLEEGATHHLLAVPSDRRPGCSLTL